MEQYPEYKFIQSSSYHSHLIKTYYPQLFERIRERVYEGRYEPNGAVWVECDCNITSGESMIRQFVWGQRFTRENFGYTSDCFWLPDTFGYSAAIPQIMKGCSVDYFLTTKISWNDTNTFPYDTFYWQGIDGTKVFSHFNISHTWPDVKSLREQIIPNDTNSNSSKQPSVNNKRLIAFGFGDGGGGPQFEMIEIARRLADLQEVPRAYFTTVSDFMKDLEATSVEPNIYRGELYLELHRGTLTNQHEIKRNNRKAELKLRDLEYLTVCKAFREHRPCSTVSTNELYGTLLVNQFHDILPGTCIHTAHEQCKQEMRTLLREADARIRTLAHGDGTDCITLTNTLSFDRGDIALLPFNGRYIQKLPQQEYTTINGQKQLILASLHIPALSSVVLPLTDTMPSYESPFIANGSQLTTPYYEIAFDENGFITSCYDIAAQRQLVNGLPFNTFLMAEDVPAAWDNWDIDADTEMRFKPCARLLSREVISQGAAAYILRSRYQISDHSFITQDMLFFADSPEIRFDTYMDWQDNHRFLKTAFDVNVHEDFARQEIQFGCCKRPTTRNTSLEQAKFEVVNHKYTDLSEPGYGVALLNDSKYGISVNGSRIALSLHKGGTRPDIQGDTGLHHTVYSFLPHNSRFNAKDVIHPAYALNVPYILSQGRFEVPALVTVDRPNVIIETIKPCEDEDHAFIVRLYEAEGTACHASLRFDTGVHRLVATNMLEEPLGAAVDGNILSTDLRPFEIMTIKAYY